MAKMRFSRCLVALVALLGVEASLAASMFGGVSTYGDVRDVLDLEDGTYLVAGRFDKNSLFEPADNLLHVTENGDVLEDAPGFNGEIHDLLLGQDGKIYIAGEFTQINGLNKRFLARLSEDLQLEPNWPSEGAPNVRVRALEEFEGHLYVGGDFISVGQNSQRLIARFSTSTGLLDVTWQHGGVGQVFTLQRKGSELYVGGNFNTLTAGGRASPSLSVARLNSRGELDPSWPQASIGAGINIRTFAFLNGNVFAGGNRLFKFRPDGSKHLDFTPPAALAVNRMIALDDALFAALTPNATQPLALVKIDSASGSIAPFGEIPTDVMTHISFAEGTGFIVGGRMLGDEAPLSVARMNEDGSVSSFRAAVLTDGQINEVLSLDGRLIIAGDFVAVGGAFAHHLAVVQDGALLPAPVFDRPVRDIAHYPGSEHVYIGGAFRAVDGVRQAAIARLVADSLIHDASWSLPTEGVVNALLAPELADVIVGGAELTIPEAPGSTLLRLRDGEVDPGWQIISQFAVFDIVKTHSDRILVGGSGAVRDAITGITEDRLAAVDVNDRLMDLGFCDGGECSGGGGVFKLHADPQGIVVVGTFSVDGLFRQITLFDPETLDLRNEWRPAQPTTTHIAIDNGAVYMPRGSKVVRIPLQGIGATDETWEYTVSGVDASAKVEGTFRIDPRALLAYGKFADVTPGNLGSNAVSLPIAYAVALEVQGEGSGIPVQQVVPHGGTAIFSLIPSPGRSAQILADTCGVQQASSVEWIATDIRNNCSVRAAFSALAEPGPLFSNGFEGPP